MRPIAFSLLLAGIVLLAGCNDDDDAVSSGKALDLTILHINDHHSQLDATAGFEFTVDSTKTKADLGGFPRVTAAFASYAGKGNLLKLHAGDAMTGTLYHTFFKGEADADLMNTVCFDAMTVGNHEFDEGDSGLKKFIDYLSTPRCQTPVLSANVKPQVGTPLAPTAVDDYIKPYTIKTIDGVQVGIVGITIKGKTQNSSRPLATTVFEDEVTAAQAAIDALKAKGVRNIIVMTHQGYDADKAMAAKLTDVDAIIGGDSHTLLGDFNAIGITSSSGPYPTQATNKNGEKVCIGQAWEYAKAMGEMQLSFKADGTLSSCAGNAKLLLGTNFTQNDAPVSEATKQNILTTLAAVPVVKVVDADATATSALSVYKSQVDAKKAELIGTASESLCLVRIPGESTNRSSGVTGCETANTLARGSDAGQAVAAAFLDGSLLADVAIQNAGGVRIAIPAGSLSMNTAFTVLPFTNVLVELQMTGAQIVAVLEDAVANHLDNGGSSGSHPYAAGLRWDLDMSKSKGARFSSVEVKNRTTGTWAAIDLTKTYTVVTNDFIASGQDGYATFGTIFATGNYVNTYLLYTQTFVDYIKKVGTLTRPARADYSHKTVITGAGATLPND